MAGRLRDRHLKQSRRVIQSGDGRSLPRRYGPSDWATGKAANKRHLQKRLGLLEEERAPLFFWPSRLDRIQKAARS